MNHYPAAYGGSCTICGLDRWQQITVPLCPEPYRVETPGFQDFVARHVNCAADCEGGTAYISLAGAAGPWLCTSCSDERLEAM